MTLKRINRKHIVTINDEQVIFDNLHKALEFIYKQKEVCRNG